MKLSVVMTTYNGEKFIIEQLESIRKQSKQPDEVLIYDDVSDDKTPSLVLNYIEKYDLKSWKLHLNTKNIGWKHNFIKAMKAASGDIIFLCDQDDIWMKDKLECMSTIMEENKEVRLLVGNSINFYTSNKKNRVPFYSFKRKEFYLNGIWNGNSIIFKINQLLKKKKKNSNKIVKIAFDESILVNQRQGCVMAVRKDLKEDIMCYWNEECPHDTLLWFYAAAHDNLYLLEKYVINYRHHDENTGFKETVGDGLTSRSELNKIHRTHMQLEQLKLILKDNNINNKKEKLEVINNIKKYNEIRIRFLLHRHISDGLLIIRGKKYVGARQVLFDWLLAYLT